MNTVQTKCTFITRIQLLCAAIVGELANLLATSCVQLAVMRIEIGGRLGTDSQ